MVRQGSLALVQTSQVVRVLDEGVVTLVEMQVVDLQQVNRVQVLVEVVVKTEASLVVEVARVNRV